MILSPPSSVSSRSLCGPTDLTNSCEPVELESMMIEELNDTVDAQMHHHHTSVDRSNDKPDDAYVTTTPAKLDAGVVGINNTHGEHTRDSLTPSKNGSDANLNFSRGLLPAIDVGTTADPIGKDTLGSVACHSTYGIGVKCKRAPPKSALKSSSVKNKGLTMRRVRGLWKESSADCFSQLRDATIEHILSFLSMADLCSLSVVSKRWQHLALDQTSWENVDASDFVHRAFAFYHAEDPSSAPKRTADALTSRLDRYATKRLVIRCIRNRLHPENFLSSITWLQELVLGEFDELSDTHVHVLLLSSAVLAAQARTKSSNSLRRLVLTDCLLLTNSTVKSIASLCPQLEHLSLRGCRNITNVLPLKDLFKTDEVDPQGSGTKLSSVPASSAFQSLFAHSPPLPHLAKNSHRPVPTTGLGFLFRPPPLSGSTLGSLFSPPAVPAASVVGSSYAPPPAPVATGLGSLFAPPPLAESSGMSSLFVPPLTHGTPTFPKPPPPSPSESASFNFPLYASAAKLPPTAQKGSLASLFAPPGDTPPPPPVSGGITVRRSNNNLPVVVGKLTSLDLSYTGVTARALADAIRAAPGNVVLEYLEMKGSGESWTDSVLQQQLGSCEFKVLDIGCLNPTQGSWGVTDTGFRSLVMDKYEKLCISGQKGIKTGSITKSLLSACKLQCLSLEACPSVFAGDDLSVAGMVFAFQKSVALEYINVSRCFSDETRATPQILKSEEQRGKLFLEAICNSTSRLTLRELDLSWCWFVTASEVAKLKRACPKLERLHLMGTRCSYVPLDE